MIAIFMFIVLSEFRTPIGIAIPCSVKAKGKYLIPPLLFEVTICDLKEFWFIGEGGLPATPFE
jgi:hypothetical protein